MLLLFDLKGTELAR